MFHKQHGFDKIRIRNFSYVGFISEEHNYIEKWCYASGVYKWTHQVALTQAINYFRKKAPSCLARL